MLFYIVLIVLCILSLSAVFVMFRTILSLKARVSRDGRQIKALSDKSFDDHIQLTMNEVYISTLERSLKDTLAALDMTLEELDGELANAHLSLGMVLNELLEKEKE